EREKAQALVEGKPPEPEKKTGILNRLLAPNPNMPSSEEYRKWRRIYWILLAIGIVVVIISMLYNNLVDKTLTPILIFFMVIAYGTIIGALVVDFRKVKPLLRAHQQAPDSKTPKQIKHQQEAAAEAARLEEARKAAKASRKFPRRRPRVEEQSETLDTDVAGEVREETSVDSREEEV
ncbi:MAG: hypothetical protein LBJ76_01655, partial [Candidatus Accumulibacter sp.]|nr:hypothetical protein [Accumulibacter sp.]